MKTTSLARTLKSSIKKDVMAYAWKLARKQAKKDNCTPRDCFSWALSKAWYHLKALCTARKGLHAENAPQLGSLCLWSSPWADLAENFPNVCELTWSIIDTERKCILYTGTLRECEAFRWGSQWNEHFPDVEHANYTQAFYCPLLWA